MPEQVKVVNGHSYYVMPTDNYLTYPDYIVEVVGAQVACGFMRWAGNGTTTFNYQAYDPLEESLGVYPDLDSALGALDARLYPSG